MLKPVGHVAMPKNYVFLATALLLRYDNTTPNVGGIRQAFEEQGYRYDGETTNANFVMASYSKEYVPERQLFNDIETIASKVGYAIACYH